MSAGGFCKLPNGSVVVALTVPSPSPDDGAVRVLVHAANRARALTRLRNLGLRAIYLRGNAEPPRPTRSQRSSTTRTACSGEPPPLRGGRTVAPDQSAHETETPRPGRLFQLGLQPGGPFRCRSFQGGPFQPLRRLSRVARG